MWVGGLRHALAALRLGKGPGSDCTGAPGPIWTGSGNVALTGFQSSDRPARSKSK